MSNQQLDIWQELNKLIAKAEHDMSLELTKFLKTNSNNISPMHWRVLECLKDNQGHSMTEISQQIHANDSTLTKTVDKMVNESLVYRKPDSKDRRKVLVFISKKGKSLHEKLEKPWSKHFSSVFAAEHSDITRLNNNLRQFLNSQNKHSL